MEGDVEYSEQNRHPGGAAERLQTIGPLRVVGQIARQGHLGPDDQLGIGLGQVSPRQVAEYSDDPTLVLRLPLLLLRNVRLNDGDRSHRPQYGSAHAVGTIADHRDDQRSHTAEPGQHGAPVLAQQPRIGEQPVTGGEPETHAAHTAQVGKLGQHGESRRRQP